MTYRCISDRYDPTGGHYDSVEDFGAMCEACFGEAPELRQDGEQYRDDQGIVLVPDPEYAEQQRLSEIAAALPIAEAELLIATRPVTTHRTRTGLVRLCAEHEQQCIDVAGDPTRPLPEWHDELGLDEYLGVHRGPGGRRVCDACAWEALTAAGHLGTGWAAEPHHTDHDGRSLVEHLRPAT
jgi:hypothetical protein